MFQGGKVSAEDFNQSPLYFTRTRGLFRECYLGEKLEEDPANSKVPIREDIYISPVETYCRNIDYFIPDENDQTKTFNKEEMTRVRKFLIECFRFQSIILFSLPSDMMRAMIALFIVGFFFMFVSFTAGIRGCWKTSPSNITASAILMLIACLFHAGGMGLWHGVEHWENEKIKASSDSQSELFKMNWSEVRTS